MSTPIDMILNGVEWIAAEPPDTTDDGIPYATHSGMLRVGEFELRCYQLSDGQRIFDADDLATFFNQLNAGYY